MLQGIHYRSRWFYELQNRFKLGRDYALRFKIAAEYLKPGVSVLDLCSGFGEFKDYLPPGCRYRCIEASAEFTKILQKKNIPVLVYDLHQTISLESLNADAAVMIVSLCHFRSTTAGELLEALKQTAHRVIIVEDVLDQPRGEQSWIHKAMNYFCRTEYYRPTHLFTAEEFEALMRRHGYECRRYNDRYRVGYYGPSIERE